MHVITAAGFILDAIYGSRSLSAAQRQAQVSLSVSELLYNGAFDLGAGLLAFGVRALAGWRISRRPTGVPVTRRQRGAAASVVVIVWLAIFLAAWWVLQPRQDRRAAVATNMVPNKAAPEPSPPWWLWAAGRISAPTSPGDASAEPWDGPAATRAPAAPVEVAVADGGTATEDDCRGIWLFRHLLPPVGDGENLLVSLRQLGSTLAVVGKGRSLHLDGSIDLGFDVRVESAAVAIDAATSCEVQSASHHGEPYEVRITCTAPTRVEAPIGAALGDGFSVVARRGDTTFWRVDFGRPDRKASATTALIEALGSSEQEPAPAELSAAYKRLTSPFERLMVWRGGHGGDDEAAMLQRAQRYDLLRGVLRGPNPEGRALAAVALREAGAFTPDDRRVLQILAKATLAIRVAAEDDMAGQWPSSKFFSQPRWPVRSDFRSL